MRLPIFRRELADRSEFRVVPRGAREVRTDVEASRCLVDKGCLREIRIAKIDVLENSDTFGWRRLLDFRPPKICAVQTRANELRQLDDRARQVRAVKARPG